jgi:hypothetical protein
MAFFTGTKTVQSFAGALYGVQVGSTLMAEVNRDIDRNGLNQTLNTYFNASFGSELVATTAAKLVASLGITTGSAEAIAYVVGKLTPAGAAKGEAIAKILQDFSSLTGDLTYGAAAKAWNAKVDAATAYKGTDTLPLGSNAIHEMSVGLDDVVGSAGNDTINARVVQNDNGEQTNQLATGDSINGGAGTDTLTAKVIAASALNMGPAMYIAAETVDVEKVAFTALRSIASSSTPETVEINAKFMDGLDMISSVHSDASLLVTNVNTLTDSGDYAAKRLTESLTVRMDHSGNDLTVPESNMTVLFDNDYLLAADPSQSVTLKVALTPQIEAAKYDATAPLKNNPYDTLTIKVDGVSKVINIATGTPATPVQTTYAALETAIKDGLVAAGLSDVVVTRNVGDFVYSARDGAARSADTFTLSKPGSVLTTQGAGSWEALAGLPDDNSFGAIVRPGDASSTAPLVTVQVELEKVGRGSDGGGLIIGGMATAGANTWDFSSKPNLKEGVEKFNVKVSGDASQFSSLSYLHSTNNTLQSVVVTSATGSKADLIIGNQNTGSAITDAMKDVREFTSTAFANNVTLNAKLTTEVVAKYMNLTDTAAPAADNISFNYNFGAGNDTLKLDVAKANAAAAGTTTREDFVLSIDGGAGNDKITVDLSGNETEIGLEAWYNNSKINANLSINGGAGNDTISTLGAGDFKILGGAGDDTVYSDNSGNKAIWVFNTTDQLVAGSSTTHPVARDMDDLISSANTSYKLYKGTAEVTFRGLVSTKVVIESSTTTYQSTDLQINQAIKQAINSDAVLNKLIKATDGPANTLVVTSLIDGVRVDADLAVAIAAPAAAVLTAAEIGSIAGVYGGGLAATDSAVRGDMATVFGDYAARVANTAANAPTAGTDSNAATDSTHTLGAGNDVLVLSTNHSSDAGDTSANMTSSNETVVYNAIDFGNDTIVNFNTFNVVPFSSPSAADAAPTVVDAGEDKLNFTALGGKTFIGTTAIGVGDLNVIAVRSLVTTTLDDASDVAALFSTTTTNTAATSHIVVLVNSANVGTVYQVTDGAGNAAASATAVSIGTIDLADTPWLNLSADNFA